MKHGMNAGKESERTRKTRIRKPRERGRMSAATATGPILVVVRTIGMRRRGDRGGGRRSAGVETPHPRATRPHARGLHRRRDVEVAEWIGRRRGHREVGRARRRRGRAAEGRARNLRWREPRTVCVARHRVVGVVAGCRSGGTTGLLDISGVTPTATLAALAGGGEGEGAPGAAVGEEAVAAGCACAEARLAVALTAAVVVCDHGRGLGLRLGLRSEQISPHVEVVDHSGVEAQLWLAEIG